MGSLLSPESPTHQQSSTNSQLSVVVAFSLSHHHAIPWQQSALPPLFFTAVMVTLFSDLSPPTTSLPTSPGLMLLSAKPSPQLVRGGLSPSASQPPAHRPRSSTFMPVSH